jgi:hypothetical protein
MIQTIPDFEDSSAFERFALGSVYPLMGSSGGSVFLDLRTTPVNLTFELTSLVNGRDEARNELIQDLRPLLFGAAWNIIDLLLELAFFQAGLQPSRAGQWSIAEKHGMHWPT